MLYMVLERFKNGDPRPVFGRFADRGRLMPKGLTYVDSWVDQSLDRCFQVMETEDPNLLHQWIDQWRDLVDFEVLPVLTSSQAAKKVAALP